MDLETDLDISRWVFLNRTMKTEIWAKSSSKRTIWICKGFMGLTVGHVLRDWRGSIHIWFGHWKHERRYSNKCHNLSGRTMCLHVSSQEPFRNSLEVKLSEVVKFIQVGKGIQGLQICSKFPGKCFIVHCTGFAKEICNTFPLQMFLCSLYRVCKGNL